MGKGPLLFIKTPPAYFKKIEELPKIVEEIENVEEIEKVEEPVEVLEESVPKLADGELQKRREKLLFLSNPFQQKVYQPLVFIVNDGREISGEVHEVNVETQEVLIRTTNDEVQPIAIPKLKDLLWRGRSFLE